MEIILVTTDLSANSVAGMRFAIRLAELRKAVLTFLVVHEVLPVSSWSEEVYAHQIKKDRERIMKEAAPFVKRVYRALKINPARYDIEVHHNLDTVDGITEYAKECHADYVCISTRGAGNFKKIFGTNTGALISKSHTPVLCIPVSYRAKPIKTVLYAADMNDYENELQKVVAFAKPIGAAVQMLHFFGTAEFIPDKQLMEVMLFKKLGYPVKILYKKRHEEYSLAEEITRVMAEVKPSVLAMFTRQHRSFFERILLPAKTKQFSYTATIPMLSFNKE